VTSLGNAPHCTSRRAPGLVAALFLAGGIAVCANASAQVQRSGGGGGAANAQLMMQYQQADAERTQLKSENTKLKKDLDDLKKQLDAASKQAVASKAGVGRDAAQLAAAQAANDRSAKDLADSKGKMQELVGKFRETITQMRGIEAERSQLQQQLAQSKTAFDQCAERNYSLYQVDNEVLDRYAHEGAFSHMASAEPFTRIKRTQIDNLVLEYKERAEELRLKKAEAASGSTAPASVATSAPAGGQPRASSSGTAASPSPTSSPPAATSGAPAAPNSGTAPTSANTPTGATSSGTPAPTASTPAGASQPASPQHN
jgi:regulator of replication initiation timing